MKKSIAILSFLLCLSLSARSQQLYINELMASNKQTVADSTGAYEDWFEIYNPNSFSVNIAGYYVTDKLSSPTKYQFPTGSPLTVVPANGFLLVWASGVPARGANHVSFNLSASGEQVGLYRLNNSALEVVDSLSFGQQRTDISWGRQPDGSSTWLYFQASANNTSPGASNNGKTGFAQSLTTPTFSKTGGFYPTAFNLAINSTDPSVTIYYTLDGSAPDPSNPNSVTFAYKNSYPQISGQPYGPFLTGSYQTLPYSTTLAISDRTNSPNSVSTKSSTWHYQPNYFPTSPVFKGTVVRAIAYKANAIASDIVTQTYFVTPTTPRYPLPVVSVAVNEKDLFEYQTGIYTAGKVFDDLRAADSSLSVNFCTPGNFTNEGSAWRKRANVEFFINNTSVINQTNGLSIHGNCSRSAPRKGLQLIGDSNFQYPFFVNRPPSFTYNSLILRNGGNDWNYSIIVDAYAQTMVRHLNFDTQSNRPGIVFLNGEYWGVHTICEHYDKEYINRGYGVATDSLDLMQIRFGYEVQTGDSLNYKALLAYFNQNSPIDYNYAKTQIDIENFADYQISEIYATNTDWPNNNQEFWRKRTNQYTPNAPHGQDGRWRWMMKDMDYSLSYANSYTFNAFSNAMQVNDYTLFFRRLLDIPDFKTYFINRYADLLNTTFDSTRTSTLLTSVLQDYQASMPEDLTRWLGGISYNDWLTNVDSIRSFVQHRPPYVRSHILSQFGLTANRNLTVDVSDTTQGYVKVNTITILPTTVGIPTLPYPWTGIYFQGNPVTVVAKIKKGYKFQYWKEGNAVVSSDTAYTFNPTANRSLVAVFDLDDSFNSIPVSYSLLSCDYKFTSWTATAPAATFPANMQFVMLNQEDPPLTATISTSVSGAYSYTSRTRINGLGANGISFINTSNNNTNPGYVASTLGGALLALRTTGLAQAYVQWTGGTVTPNPRQYGIRLRYRVGDSGAFTDLLDSSNNPVQYVRNATAGHSQVIGPIALPANLLNKTYVQLLWQYYWTGVGTSGARDELRLDDIIITRSSCASLSSADWNSPTTWSCGHVPTLCDAVLINNGHVVTVTIPNAIAKSLQFGTNAHLQYTNATASLRIQNN